jgi:hypothetical protein
MDFQSLVGRTFHENQIYELLQFDAESNFDFYVGKYFTIYYEPLPEGCLKITELIESCCHDEYFAMKRRDLGKRSWLEIYENHGHIDLHLCRQDTSGKLSVVHKTHTHFQEVRGRCFADEGVDSNAPPMTPEQIRQAFRELMGICDDHEQMNKSKTKIAV